MLVRKYLLVFVLIFLLVYSSIPIIAKLDPVVHIVNNVPELLEIQDFSFKIDSYDDEYQFKVTVKNNSSQKIEAYGISFLVFDYFNERNGGLTGVSHSAIDSGGTSSGTWTDKDYSAWAGLTAFAFVSKIRLDDGTVVKASSTKVAEEISRILGEQIDAEDVIDKQ